jgi:hypothetical protein
MDPADLRPRSRAESVALTRVQQWIMSTLVASLILHLAAGLVVAAYMLDEERLDARIGLVVISGILGFLAVVVALVTHRHKMPTWWLLVGVVPGLAAAWVVFG